MMKKVKTGRLELSLMSDEQLAELAQRADEPDLRAAYAQMLALCREHPQERRWYAPWQIALKTSGVPVGDLGFKGPPADGAVEIGYGVEESHRCRGYATEACQALIEWAFVQENVYVVEAETAADNEISQRVLQKLGFRACGLGAEGPRFEKEKPASGWLAIYMCLGMSVGMCFGVSTANTALGMCLGTCFGMMIGAAMDAAEKKKRAALRTRRTGLVADKQEE